MSEQKIVVYSAPGIELLLPLDLERDTVRATQAQIVDLFGIDVSGVSRHIRNVFKNSEVDEQSNLQKMQIASSDRPVTLCSLDVVLAGVADVLSGYFPGLQLLRNYDAGQRGCPLRHLP